jgi:hypothetical protein
MIEKKRPLFPPRLSETDKHLRNLYVRPFHISTRKEKTVYCSFFFRFRISYLLFLSFPYAIGRLDRERSLCIYNSHVNNTIKESFFFF